SIWLNHQMMAATLLVPQILQMPQMVVNDMAVFGRKHTQEPDTQSAQALEAKQGMSASSMGSNNKSETHKKKWRIDPIRLIFALILIMGVSVMAYPFVMQTFSKMASDRLLVNFEAAVNQLSQAEIDALMSQAQAYNDEIAQGAFTFTPDEAHMDRYKSLLCPAGDTVMGVIEIPSINVYLPIEHDANEFTLGNAVGHLPGTSLPIGSQTGHAVLSGHRGLPTARLFTDLDQVREGDVFYLHVLQQTFAYEVDSIRTVLPYETQLLKIEEGKDYVTLVTCTPYGVNTHRLLIRGHRVEFDGVAATATDARQLSPGVVALSAAGIVVGLAVFGFMIRTLYRRIRKRR
ncbi:MAG: class C sortase, partial [Eggerthellaceae bacterium]|nr:class C sortase [Eggerthellaceae bacterium]